MLAGAWTDTGWPATLEGAVLSGHAAARCALEALGGAEGVAPGHGRGGSDVSDLLIAAPLRLEAWMISSGIVPLARDGAPHRHGPAPRARGGRRRCSTDPGRRCW